MNTYNENIKVYNDILNYIYNLPKLPVTEERMDYLRRNALSQTGLWKFGINGDNPIMIGNTIAEQAQSVQVDPMYLDSADIDFDNSFVYYSSPEGSSDANITITLLY